MSRTDPVRRRVAVTVALTASLVAVPAALAAPAHARDARVAYVRAAHLSPDTPRVDVYLTSFRGGSTKLWLKGVGYGDVSPYRRMQPGEYAVAMRPAGAARTTPAALNWTVTLRAGDAYTAFAIGQQRSLHGMVVADAPRTPGAGQGLVRVVQASDRARQVTVVAGRTTVSPKIGFGAVSDYVTVPAGTVALTARSLQNSALSGSRAVRVASRSVTTVLLLDRQDGGIEARPLLDAAGPAHAPTGSVPAGGGGTARDLTGTSVSFAGLSSTVWIAVAALIAAGACGVTATARRRRSAT